MIHEVIQIFKHGGYGKHFGCTSGSDYRNTCHIWYGAQDNFELLRALSSVLMGYFASTVLFTFLTRSIRNQPAINKHVTRLDLIRYAFVSNGYPARSHRCIAELRLRRPESFAITLWSRQLELKSR